MELERNDIREDVFEKLQRLPEFERSESNFYPVHDIAHVSEGIGYQTLNVLGIGRLRRELYFTPITTPRKLDEGLDMDSYPGVPFEDVVMKQAIAIDNITDYRSICAEHGLPTFTPTGVEPTPVHLL